MSQDQVGRAPKNRHHYTADEKKAAVDLAAEIGSTAAAAKLGVHRGNIDRWSAAFRQSGVEALVNKSSRPHHQPKKTSQWIIDKIKGLKKKSPEMGMDAVSMHLERNESIRLAPATVAKIFKKEGLPGGDAGHAEQSYRIQGDKDKRLERTVEAELDEWERFARPNPDELWQMDIMCFYIRGDAKQVHLITALDDCSRMIVGWGLVRSATSEAVLEVLRGALARHGAPQEILTDQGAQFKHWKGITQFERLLAKLKIQHIKARSHHPQTCGKIEAYHKTIQRELIDKEFFFSQEKAIERIARFVEHYNHTRPHSALGGYTPADRYYGVIDAVKKYIDDFREPKNEAEEKEERVVIGRGSKLYLIGKVLGQDVRIQELAGQISVHLGGQLVREINLLS